MEEEEDQLRASLRIKGTGVLSSARAGAWEIKFTSMKIYVSPAASSRPSSRELIFPVSRGETHDGLKIRVNRRLPRVKEKKEESIF